MKTTEIKEALKEIKLLAFKLRMSLNTIERDEFINLTSKLDSKLEKLIDNIEKD